MRIACLALLCSTGVALAAPPASSPAAATATGPASAPATGVDADLDGDDRPEHVAVDGDRVRVTRADGRVLGELGAPPHPGALGPATARVVSARDDLVLHVVWPLAGGRAAELVADLGDDDRLQTIWSGVTGPEGRDGEWAERLRVDGQGVLRYQTAPAVRRCDGDDVLFPSLWDDSARRFRPVAIVPPVAGKLTATRLSDAEARAGTLGLFHFTAASSQRGDEGRADALRPPVELEDGRLDTAWIEGAAGPGRGAWVTARAHAPGLEVTAIDVVPRAGGAPKKLALLVGKERFEAALPTVAPGAMLAIALPRPVPADCVSLAILDGNAADTGLAEARVRTQLDGADGVAQLVQRVADGAAGADGLAQTLARLGARGVPAIAAALPRVSGDARRRLVRALLASDAPEAAAPLVTLLGDGTRSERELVVDALGHDASTPLAEAALAPLEALVRATDRPSAGRVAALGVLAAWRRGDTLVALVGDQLAGALGDDSGVREAMVRLAAREEAPLAPLVERVAQDLAGSPRHLDDDARLLARLAARAHGHDAAIAPAAATAIARLWQLAPATDFAARFLALRAARASAHPSLASLLDGATRDGDEALRWAAVEAAGALDDGAGRSLVERALGDRDPRVRASALSLLAAARSPSLASAAARALAGDRWPFVREAAALALEAACPGDAASALATTVAHDTLEVRKAALASLGRCDPGRAAPLALHLVGDAHAPPELRELGARLVLTLRPAGAAPVIARALAGVLEDPRADEKAAGLAAALARAAGALGDPVAERPLFRALVEPAAPSIRAAAATAVGELCTSDAKQALVEMQHKHDADADVRRAVERAAAKCH